MYLLNTMFGKCSLIFLAPYTFGMNPAQVSDQQFPEAQKKLK